MKYNIIHLILYTWYILCTKSTTNDDFTELNELKLGIKASNVGIFNEMSSVEEVRNLEQLSYSARDGINADTNIVFDNKLTVIYDPPDLHFEPTALGVFTRASNRLARIYYEVGMFEAPRVNPRLNSSYATFASPYIQLDTPYLASRNKVLSFIAVVDNGNGVLTKSQQYNLKYYVEAAQRPKSYAFLVPGVETRGYFVRVCLIIYLYCIIIFDYITNINYGPVYIMILTTLYYILYIVRNCLVIVN